MKPFGTRLVLGGVVLFILCTAGFCEDVVDSSCGDGFVDVRGDVRVGDFGASEEAIAFERFLNAIATLESEAAELNAEAGAACRDIGLALAMDDSLLAVGSYEQNNETCRNVAAELDTYRMAFEDANLTVTVEVEPARCSADFDASVDCYAECDVNVDIDVTPPTCTGGTVYVGCDVGCRGECHLPSATVECAGHCEGMCTGGCTGSCTGSCTGTCSGFCDGTCDVYDGEGNCAGVCDGTCRGECDATCEGECWGTCTGECDYGCVVEVDGGGCEGECWGDCDVDIDPIRCEGGEFEVDASADCQAACEAELSFEAECTPPRVFVHIDGDTAEVEAMALLYIDAMEAALPGLIAVLEQLGYTFQAAVELAAATPNGINAAVVLGARSLLCAADAIDLAVDIRFELEVTVNVSGDVQAAAAVEGG